MIQNTAYAKCKLALSGHLMSMGLNPIGFYVGQSPGALDRSLASVAANAKSKSDPLHEVLAPIRTLAGGAGTVGRMPNFAMAHTVNTAQRKLEEYRAKALSEYRTKLLSSAKVKAQSDAAAKAAEQVDKNFEITSTSSAELWREATGGQFDSIQSWQEFQSHASFRSARKGEIIFGLDGSTQQISMQLVKDKNGENLMVKMGTMQPVAIKWPADRNENTSHAYLANLLEGRFLEDGELNLAKSVSVADRMHLHQFMFGVVRDNMTVLLPRGASADLNAGQVSRQIESEIASASLPPQAESAYWSARNQLTGLSRVLNSPHTTRASASEAWSQTETEILLNNVVQSLGVMHATTSTIP